MTPQERAEALFKRICAMGKIELGHNPEGEADAIAVIEEAIIGAEDGAYDLAAEQTEGGVYETYGNSDGGYDTYFESVPAADIKAKILALKSKEA